LGTLKVVQIKYSFGFCINGNLPHAKARHKIAGFAWTDKADVWRSKSYPHINGRAMKAAEQR